MYRRSERVTGHIPEAKNCANVFGALRAKHPGKDNAYIYRVSSIFNTSATRRRYVQRENYERQADTVYPSAVAASFKGWLPEEQSPLSTGAPARSSEKQGIRHRRRSQGITSI
jgi:hypothetical protein